MKTTHFPKCMIDMLVSKIFFVSYLAQKCFVNYVSSYPIKITKIIRRIIFIILYDQASFAFQAEDVSNDPVVEEQQPRSGRDFGNIASILAIAGKY